MLKRMFRDFLIIPLICAIKRNRFNVAGRSYSIISLQPNPLAKFIWRWKEYEADMTDVLRLALRLKEGAFLDVGANIGQTLIKLLSLDATRRYVGFEPQLMGCASTADFIQGNRLTAHTVLPVGLSDHSGIAKLGTRGKNSVTASTVDEYRPKDFFTEYLYVPVVMGDKIVEQLELHAVAVIKVDVEGGELEVFKGLSGTLRQFRPFLIFEVLPHYLIATKKVLDAHTRSIRDMRHRNTDSLLRSLEYALFKIELGGVLTEVSELKAAERQLFNYFAVPKECVTDLHEHINVRLTESSKTELKEVLV